MSRKTDAYERIFITSDQHSVFLNRKPWKIFLGICAEEHPSRVVLNGDVLDCTSISVHAKKIHLLNPEVLSDYSFDYELEMTYQEILKPLRKAIGNAKMDMRLGNHEMRLVQPDQNNTAALGEILKTCAKRGCTKLEDLLKLDKVGCKLSYRHVDDYYGFTVIHGVKTSANAAKANLLRYGSGTSGHSHRGNSFTQVMNGKLQGWWESGCFRTLDKIEYLPHGDKPDWCNSFLSLTINKNTGKFFCKTHYIIGDECEFNGTIYRA